MPTYDYFCQQCGDFAAVRNMASRNDPHACPQCGGAAYRVLTSAPQLGLVSAETRTAHAINERAANIPKTNAEYAAGRKHAPGCGCCSGISSRNTVKSADGAKAFPSKRPWMISH